MCAGNHGVAPQTTPPAPRWGSGDEPIFVFGETKSFAEEAVRPRDVEVLKDVARCLPGSFMVVAVLKEDFSAAEKSLLSDLAGWCRESIGQDSRAHLIVLTGTELFSGFYLHETWKAKGGRFAEAIAHPSVDLSDPFTLANLTQQLYLDLPSFFDDPRPASK